MRGVRLASGLLRGNLAVLRVRAQTGSPARYLDAGHGSARLLCPSAGLSPGHAGDRDSRTAFAGPAPVLFGSDCDILGYASISGVDVGAAAGCAWCLREHALGTPEGGPRQGMDSADRGVASNPSESLPRQECGSSHQGRREAGPRTVEAEEF